MSKPLQSEHQRYHVQCCIADPTAHLDPRCRLGMTGRAELNLAFPQPAAWFTPDDDSVKKRTAFPMRLKALLFSPDVIEDMADCYRRLLTPVEVGFEIVPKNRKTKKLKRLYKFHQSKPCSQAS